MARTFLLLFLSSAATEVIGVHALFGAFLAGVVMPGGAPLRERITTRIHDLSLVVLLPLFFAVTGLRTRVGLLDSPSLRAATGVVIFAAVAGKMGGTVLAARLLGRPWRESLSLGALMNTRGLMELVVLNLGYEMGILTPEVFSMMVIMAMLTTFMAGPCLSLIDRVAVRDAEPARR